MCRANEKWVNFLLGTDQHGFFLTTANSNGSMPFPHVTLNEVSINAWSQLVYVKDEQGYQTFYKNGTAIHSDKEAASAGKVHPFRDVEAGEPLRLAVPMGDRIGEAWIHSRALSADEIKKDFEAKRDCYKPLHPTKLVLLREMNAHPAARLWRIAVAP